MKCYVAGPMTGREALNFPAFFAAEGRLRGAGWEVLNPARIQCEEWTAGRDLDNIHGPEFCRRVAERDLGCVMSLRAEDGDALVLLPGSEQSVGANSEVWTARWCKLPVLTVDEAIERANAQADGAGL